MGIPTGVPIHVVLLLAGAYLIGSLPGLAVAILAMAAAELAGTLVLHGIARTGGVRLLERMASDRQERRKSRSIAGEVAWAVVMWPSSPCCA